MKRFVVAFLLVTGPGVAGAQVPVSSHPPLVNQYIEDGLEQRSPAWWKALESQLALTLDKSVEQVDEVSLQNVIYFATNHSDRMRLTDSAPSLMEIYEHHQHAGFRMMALAALHAIGDERYLARAYSLTQHANSERLNRMARAALADVHERNR
ncbi:MAG: hypothetical protein HKN37_10905 [Rhodothermales bacterium]|nr:hypothetical protein [Rhodothermales bacterium]